MLVTFIPRSSPKSWIVSVSAALVALLVCGPVMFLGAWLQVPVLYYLGSRVAIACIALTFLLWPFYMFRLLAGKYRNLSPRDKKEQLWRSLTAGGTDGPPAPNHTGRRVCWPAVHQNVRPPMNARAAACNMHIMYISWQHAVQA